jgi:hypothetical protein
MGGGVLAADRRISNQTSFRDSFRKIHALRGIEGEVAGVYAMTGFGGLGNIDDPDLFLGWNEVVDKVWEITRGRCQSTLDTIRSTEYRDGIVQLFEGCVLKHLPELFRGQGAARTPTILYLLEAESGPHFEYQKIERTPARNSWELSTAGAPIVETEFEPFGDADLCADLLYGTKPIRTESRAAFAPILDDELEHSSLNAEIVLNAAIALIRETSRVCNTVSEACDWAILEDGNFKFSFAPDL